MEINALRKLIDELLLNHVVSADLAIEADNELVKLESADFWNNWVYPDGATAEEIQDELSDYFMMINEVAKVYGHITGGRISKPNTKAFEVIGEYENRVSEMIDEAIKNERDEAEERQSDSKCGT